MVNLKIRDADEGDASLILKFVTDLAAYEKARDEVIATESDIRLSIFGINSTTHALICEADGTPIGFAA